MSFKLPGGDSIRIGETDITLPVSLRSATDGAGVTGLTNSSVTLTYWRQGGSPTPIVAGPLTAINSAHSDGAFLEASSGSQPGTYRLDVPDAAFVQGADWLVVEVHAPTTAGAKMQFTLTEDGLVRSGTAQSGAAGTITLDANASVVTNAYVEDLVYIAAGTGADQARMITSYITTTKVASVHKNWDVNPGADSIFLISASHGGVAPNNYSGVTVRVHPMNYSGMTVAVDDIAPASYSGVTVAVDDIAPASYSGVTVAVDDIAPASYSGVSVGVLDITPAAYSGVTVGTGDITPGTYSGVTVGIDNIAPASLLSMSISTGGTRYVQDAFAAMRNRVDITASTVTVYAGDDASVAWSGTVTRSQMSAIQTINPA